MRIVVSVVFGLSLSGCASTTTAFFSRPVVKDQIAGVVNTVSLSADRRTVIVANDPRSPVRYCAEPPPDTATSLKTDFSALLKNPKNELSFQDSLVTSVTVLSARNAPLDAFRTGMYALCQFYMNGAIGDKDVMPMFAQLLKTYENTQNGLPPVVAASNAAAGRATDSTASGKSPSTGASR